MSEHAEGQPAEERAELPKPERQAKPKIIEAQRIEDNGLISDSAELGDNGSYYRVWRKADDAQESEDI